MGTGASVEKRDTSTGPYSFALVERLSREDYFRNNVNAYQLAVEDSIKNNVLDVLEILIVAGNAVKLYPLHICASAGVLEPLELLVSAGFKCSLKNRDELTPLHCTATSSSVESALCAMFMSLCDPNCLYIRDARGSLPIHIAIERNNLNVLKVLVEVGTKLTSTNSKGLDVKALAKQLKRNDMLEYIDEFEQAKKSSRKKKQGRDVPVVVDMDRIMKVWEAFFENAMNRNGIADIEELDSDDESPNYRSDYSMKVSSGKAFRQNSNASGSSSGSYSSRKSTPSLSRSKSNYTADPYISIKDYYTGYDKIREWFSWILCYGTNESGQANYFVVNRYGQSESRWLVDHLEICGRSAMLHCGQSNEEQHDLGWPRYAHEAIQQGYIIFFEDTENTCKWMRLQTGETENYLPLGDDATACEELGFMYNYDSEGYPGLWVSSPQDCYYCWVLVLACPRDVAEDKRPSDNDYYDTIANRKKRFSHKDHQSDYYFNRLTGTASWDEPPGYHEYCESIGGWVLCISEDSSWQLFWWHPSTGGTAWA